MSDDWRTDWVSEKVALATRLGSGECGGSYAEAVIVLCGVLSAMAAERWPGQFKDRKRFVELLYRYADADLNPTRIAVPLLIANLGATNRTSEQRILQEALMPRSDTRVIVGDEVDRSESEIVGLCSSLNAELLRRFCYATLLYEDIRSSYAHEYMPGPRTDSWGMGSTHAQGRVSYTNRMNMGSSTVERLIYFNATWLANVALSVERNIRPLVPDRAFSQWWLPK
jgi:hypothetical protein